MVLRGWPAGHCLDESADRSIVQRSMAPGGGMLNVGAIREGPHAHSQHRSDRHRHSADEELRRQHYAVLERSTVVTRLRTEGGCE